MSKFDEIFKLNVNEKTEKKSGLTYLSWAWAWSEFMRFHPEASYEVVMFDGMPYVASPLGFMVFTKVTAGGMTHEMWLPVMDGANKAMKQESYSYKTKYGEKWVEAASMFDVNKTIMRCLVKNLAMFGLGLYIYAGEDLPENEDAPVDKPKAPIIPASPKTEDLGITAERLAIIQLAAENIKEHFAKGNIIDAYGEKIGITDGDESIALNNLLPSNIRSALRNHHQSLKKA
jgi:hypothetical protein